MATGWVADERFFWFDSGRQAGDWVEPISHGESGETKRRMANLIARTDLPVHLVPIEARVATQAELALAHDLDYVERMLGQAAAGGVADDGLSRFAPGDVDIARLAAGGVLAGLDAMARGQVSNVYALIRPPGHHATAGASMGFCLFNNVAIGARYAQTALGMTRVAIVDWDVHHGNGTQAVFWEDPTVLTISLHQEDLYPSQSGTVEQRGGGDGEGACVNVPLPAGSGRAAYLDAYDRVVSRALRSFAPDVVLVASGYDASAHDPFGRMQLASGVYRTLTERVLADADRLCGGRVLVTHEGGYSPMYVPFCGLAVVEALTGVRTQVVDPFESDIERRPYQSVASPEQVAAVDIARGAMTVAVGK
jgi:acetoin utilization deacetylase AcuC-like enzyme